MIEAETSQSLDFTDRFSVLPQNIKISAMLHHDEFFVKHLISRNSHEFESDRKNLDRRLKRLGDVFTDKSSKILLARLDDSLGPVGCVALSPLLGLPASEGVAEIRDLIVDPPFRGQGIGSKLLNRAIEEAKALKYDRLYLETSPNMASAKKLFLRAGFKPIIESKSVKRLKRLDTDQTFPCYFMIENLNSEKR